MSHAKRRIALAVTLAEHGGVQEFLIRFALYLQTQGHDVTIIAGEGDWLFKACQQKNIPIHKLHHLRRAIHPWHDLLAILELKRYFQTNTFDAVHLNSSKMGAIGSLAAHWSNIQNIVYRIGGWVFLEPLSPIIQKAYKTIEQISAPWKDTIICVHPGDEKVAKESHIIPRKHLTTIPNGLDLPSFEATLLPREQARAALGLEAQTFVFGTIANLFPAKDLPRYLEACKNIHDRHPNTRFLILGEGAERKVIETKKHKLKLHNIVSLPGLIPHASQYLRAFDAFVLPSAKEGMSWALMEAMGAKIPCIATDVGANVWLLDNDAGWIAQPQNTQALTNTMQTVLTQPSEASKRALQAYQRIKQDFPLIKTFQDNEKALIN